MEILLAFESTHRVLKAEEILKGADIVFRLLPAPKTLTAHCELVISMAEEDLESARRLVMDGGAGPITVLRMYKDDEYVKV